MACYKEFDEYRRKYIGRHCKTLDVALHLDEPEGTPHIHERHVWMFVDEKDKIVKIGQEEALKHAGIELPFPDRPQSRTNNRKMTFDAVMREKWYDIVEAHGIEVDRRPDKKKRKHLPKEQFIAYQKEQEYEQVKEQRKAPLK